MEEKFSTVIRSRSRLLDLKLGELWRYRDLVMLFVRRTFVAQYKQTVLGPLWAVIQPLLTTVIFTFVFGSIAGLAPSGVPTFLFYMCGNIAWTYFSHCLTSTSTTFVSNARVMGKVYFPRLVMPVSTVISQLISFGIQFVLFLGFFAYYFVKGSVAPNAFVFLTPVLVLQTAMLALGFGIIISALTTKYRDLAMLVSFGVQIWMYLTPVTYDVAMIPEKYMGIYMLNPMTPIINTLRYAFLGVGSFDFFHYIISWAVTLVVLFFGIVLFNKVEKTFMDTV